MTNFERITKSPEALAEFLLKKASGERMNYSDDSIEIYEEEFTVTNELTFDVSFEDRTNYAKDDIVTWLSRESVN